MSDFRIDSETLSAAFATRSGLALTSLVHRATTWDYIAAPSPVFGVAVDNGPLVTSDTTDVVVTSVSQSQGRLLAIGTRVTAADNTGALRVLGVELVVEVDPADGVMRWRLQLQAEGAAAVFVRVVFPLVRSVQAPPGAMAALPAEAGGVGPLAVAACAPHPHLEIDKDRTLGMPLDLDAGLPTAMNMMEVVSIYDPATGGGVFMADVDGGGNDGRVPPLQLTLCTRDGLSEIAGFWIANVSGTAAVVTPRLAVGVHTSGDWHAAVDFYVAHTARDLTAANVPEWFRRQGALYSFSGGGAGGPFLAMPIVNLNDGAVWTSFAVDGFWHPQRPPDGQPARVNFAMPLPITTAGAAPAGAPITAVMRDDRQLDLFVVAPDGAVCTTFVVGEAAWDQRLHRLTPPGAAPPGAHLLAINRSPDQLDLLFVDTRGALQTTFVTRGPSGIWNAWHTPANPPIRLTDDGVAAPGAPLAGVMRGPLQLDVFVVGNAGQLLTLFVRRIGANWSHWHGPIELPGTRGRFPPAARVVAINRNEIPFAGSAPGPTQLDVFVAAPTGIWSTFVVGNAPWHPAPFVLPGTEIISLDSGLAAIKRDAQQLDVFFVDRDGELRTTFVVGAGAWHSAPLAILRPGQTLPLDTGIAAVLRSPTQLDLFVVGRFGELSTTFVTRPDTAWAAWHPDLVRLTHHHHALPSSHLAASRRNARQVDVFLVARGQLTSFQQLPRLFEQATRLGTEILYLWDYWEGAEDGGLPPYWHKGDYEPRADLGGAEALKAGIAGVHDLGGKVVMYVEPFIFSPATGVGKEKGARIEAWDHRGSLLNRGPYVADFKALPTHAEWRQHLERVVTTLVQTYGADGVLLDSWGWQLNRPWLSADDPRVAGNPPQPPHPYPHVQLTREYNEGARILLDRLLEIAASARAPSRPEPVILGETLSPFFLRRQHGGLSADLSFRAASNDFRVLASPARYGVPGARFICGAPDLNGLHQVFAAGHMLALCANSSGTWIEHHAEHIGRLVQRRREFADALVDGRQEYQPATGAADVAAYVYRGAQHEILIVVNTSRSEEYARPLGMRGEHANSRWLEVLSDGGVFEIRDGAWTPELRVAKEGIRMLRRLP